MFSHYYFNQYPRDLFRICQEQKLVRECTTSPLQPLNNEEDVINLGLLLEMEGLERRFVYALYWQQLVDEILSQFFPEQHALWTLSSGAAPLVLGFSGHVDTVESQHRAGAQKLTAREILSYVNRGHDFTGRIIRPRHKQELSHWSLSHSQSLEDEFYELSTLCTRAYFPHWIGVSSQAFERAFERHLGEATAEQLLLHHIFMRAEAV